MCHFFCHPRGTYRLPNKLKTIRRKIQNPKNPKKKSEQGTCLEDGIITPILANIHSNQPSINKQGISSCTKTCRITGSQLQESKPSSALKRALYEYGTSGLRIGLRLLRRGVRDSIPGTWSKTTLGCPLAMGKPPHRGRRRKSGPWEWDDEVPRVGWVWAKKRNVCQNRLTSASVEDALI